MKIKLLFLLLVLLASACNKHKDHYFYLEPEVKENFFFKKGTYWIYRDSISGRVDSFYLDNSITYIEHSSNTTNLFFETISLDIIQHNSNINNGDWIRWKFDFQNSYFKFKYIKENYSLNEYYLSQFSNRGGLFNQHSLHETYDIVLNVGDYLIDSNLFKNVWQLYNSDSTSNQKYIDNHFYNDSVGFIKFRINYDDGKNKLNEVWELQRWHIVK